MTIKRSINLTLVLIVFGLNSVIGQEGSIVYESLITNQEIDGRTLNKNLMVGATPASLTVTPTGATVYNVPIRVSPGTMGVQPNLSIVYSSQGSRNGILGYGWGLSGLSAISRVAKTIYHDGEFANVLNNYTDRYALDGNRLIAIEGDYGKDQTEYGTEVESFSRITSYGVMGNGPEWLKVETREGMVMEFGRTSDSRVLANDGATVIQWKISKVYDRNTNFMEFHYHIYDGQHLISNIKYTGNSSLPQLPYAEVEFIYKTRADNTEWFINNDGKSMKIENLLEKIDLKVDGVVYRSYQFSYGLNIHSYLNKIQEFGMNGSSINSTNFKYWENNIDLAEEITTLPYSGVDYYPGDFNGDGMTDILVIHSVLDPNINARRYTYHSLYFKTNNGYQFIANPSFPTGKTSEKMFRVADFNGDGKDDLFCADIRYRVKGKTLFNPGVTYGDLQSLKVYYSYAYQNNWPSTPSVQNLDHPGWYMFSIENGNFLKIGDYNGDGASDIFWIAGDIQEREVDDPNNQYYDYFYFPKICTTHYQGTLSNSQYSIRGMANKNWLYVLDYNGDGKSELMHVWEHNAEQFHTDILEFYPYSNQTVGHSVVYNQYYPTKYHQHISFSDFNGDGKSDILTQLPNGDWEAKVNIGTGFLNYDNFSSTFYPISNGILYHEEFNHADINGDGFNDIIFTDGTSTIECYINDGEKFNHYSEPLTNTNITDAYVIDSDGDGSAEIFGRFSIFNQGPVIFDFNQQQKHGLLHKISNGMGIVQEIKHQSLSDSDPCFYERDNSANSPLIDFEKPLFVTKWVDREVLDGSTGKIRTDYRYSGGKMHTEGKGFMGFGSVKAYEHLNTSGAFITLMENEFLINTEFYFPYLISSHKSVVTTSIIEDCINYSIGKNLFSKENQYTIVNKGNNRYHLQLDFTIDGFNVTGYAIQHTYEYTKPFSISSGFPSFHIIERGIGANRTVVTTEYDYTTSGTWIPSSIAEKKITTQRGAQPAITHTFNYYYTSTNRGLLSEFVENYDIQNIITTSFESYNHFGQPLASIEEDGNNTMMRSKGYTYGPRGRFQIGEIKNYGATYTSSQAFNPYFGKVLTSTAIDGAVTMYAYNDFGNKTSETDQFGTTIYAMDWTASPTGTGGSSNVLFHSTVTKVGMPDNVTLFDKFGQIKETQLEGYSNVVYTTFEYDERGNQMLMEGPFYLGEAKPTLSNVYDDLQRLVSTTVNGSETATKTYHDAYEFFMQPYTYVNQNYSTVDGFPDGTSKTLEYDASGKLESATDAGGTVVYEYNSHGKTSSVTVNGVQSNTMVYDNVGRQTELWDRNAGTNKYLYDAFGRMIQQYHVDNSGPTQQISKNYTIAYDKLDRIVYKYSTNFVSHFEYEYYTIGNGIGQIKQAKYFGNGSSTIIDYSYNSNGLLSSKTEDINGQLSSTSYFYYPDGKLMTEKYPSKILQNTVDFHYQYNSNGYLSEVSGPNGSPIYFETYSMDAKGNYTSYNLGNGVTTNRSYDGFGFPENKRAGSIFENIYSFDASNGNLLLRSDNTHSGLTETFTYDNLSRLDKVYYYNNQTLNMDYDNTLTNITLKSDVGEYSYHPNKKNAMVQLVPYNSKVDMVQHTISYNDFDSPLTISGSNNVEWEFNYGPSQQRKRSKITRINSEGAEYSQYRYYVGNYEYETDVNGNPIREVYYIAGGDGLCAIKVIEQGSENDYYVYTDHLGSIVKISDHAGNLVFEQSFDAWGAPRNPADWAVDVSQIYSVRPDWLWRGYTGHEHLDDLQLINMNGRMYDPYVGRMLSVDNFVQDATGTQSYDRYAYALNNPLKYTDPSGEFIFTVAALIAAPFTGGASLALLPMAIGADLGVWQGGTIANGTANPLHWDYSSGKTWGYMAGGALVGAASGGAANAVATSGMAFANTAAIVTGSYLNSVGMAVLSGGQTDLSVGFGFGSYNLNTDKFGYICKKGNSGLENIGYAFGALANVQDAFALNMGTDIDYNSLKHPTGHGSITNESRTIDISKGYESGNLIFGGNGTKWGTAPKSQLFPQIKIRNVNKKLMEIMTKNIALDKGIWGKAELTYGLLGNTCTSQCARALWSAGVWGLNPITISPHSLYLQLAIRQAGIISSPFLYQIP